MPAPRAVCPHQIDVSFDHLLTFAQAAKLLPDPPSPVTMWRWRCKGVGGVLLPSVKCGGRWMTSREGMTAFINAQTAANQPAPAQPAGRSPETTQALKDAGLL